MHSNSLRKSAISLIALGSLAVAGDVRIGDNLSRSGLRFSNGTGLTCVEVNCSATSQGPSFTSIASSASLALVLSSTTADSTTVLSPGSGLLPVVAGFTPTSSAASTVNNPTTSSSAKSGSWTDTSVTPSSLVNIFLPKVVDESVPPGTFILSGGRVIARFEGGWAFTDTGAYLNGRGNAYTSSGLIVNKNSLVQADFEPILSPAFNGYSTSIVNSGDLTITQTMGTGLSIVVTPPASTSSSSTSSTASPATPLSTTPVTMSSIPTPNAPPPSTGSSTTPGSTTGTGSTTTSGTPGSTTGVGTATAGTPTGATTEPAPDAVPADSPADSMSAALSAGGGGSLPSDAPEPGTDMLIGGGLIAAGVFARVQRKNRAKQ